ncbi:MAG: hypothetical protein ACRDTF_16245, partial [Pseudonocardiaceae bacterium]
VDVATAVGRRDEVLTGEAGGVATGLLAERSDLVAILLLLAGRVEEASDLMVADQVWEHRPHPGLVVVPFLLVGGSAANGDLRWPGLLLCGLFNQVNRVDRGRGSDADLDAFHAALPAGSLPARSGGDLPLSSLLLDALSRPTAESRRRTWLDRGRAHIDARVDAVVGGQDRPSYERIAEFAAACAEAITITAGVVAGQAYLDGLHDRYPRHSLFRKELRSAATRSPLLCGGAVTCRG